MKRFVILLASVFVLGACVMPAKFHDQEAKTKAQLERAQALEKELASVKKDLAATKAALDAATKKAANTEQDLRSQIKTGGDNLASLNIQLGAVEKSNKDLQESLEAKKGELSKKVAELIKERDALSGALAGRDKELLQVRDEKAAVEKAKEDELARVKQNYEDLTSSLKSEIAAGEVTITQLKGKLTVNMVDRVLFDSGQAEVRADGKKVLEKVGKILTSVTDKDIRIEGHTDNKPIVGEDLKNKYATNWELSTARATAVLRYLQDVAKVDPKHLVAAGYGEYRPVASNGTPESRALNRRIEIVLVNP